MNIDSLVQQGEIMIPDGVRSDKAINLDLGLLAWLVLFGLGGGLLSMYYESIGYLPQIRWEESLVYLGLMTILGSFFLFLYATLLYVPGLIWCNFLICDSILMPVFEDESGKDACLKQVLRYIGLPFFVYMVYLHAILVWAPTRNPSDYVALFIGSFVGIIFSSIIFYFQIKKMKSLSGFSRDHVFKLAGYFFLSCLSSSVAVWVIYSIDGPFSRRYWLALVCTGVVVCVNVFVAITHHGDPRSARWISVVGAFVLLICGDLLIPEADGRLSARTLSIYGVGYHQMVTLAVDEKGCNILAQYGVEVKSPCTKNAAVKVENVEILSRLGSEYFLHIKGKNSTMKGQKIALPREDVLAWSTSDQ